MRQLSEASPLRYHNGSPIVLGDVVSVPVPNGTARARVVMLGETYEHLDIEPAFASWVKSDKVLQANSIVIEWLDKNPFEHDDPKYSQVGRYMFTVVDDSLMPGKRA
jgi:hypothetical protein